MSIDECNCNACRVAREKDAVIERLRAALNDMFALIDEGLLVRNTANDGQPGWALKQLPFVQRLQKAQAALNIHKHADK